MLASAPINTTFPYTLLKPTTVTGAATPVISNIVFRSLGSCANEHHHQYHKVEQRKKFQYYIHREAIILVQKNCKLRGLLC